MATGPGPVHPHPATWLNGKRWEDEVEVKIANDKPPVMYRTLPPDDGGPAHQRRRRFCPSSWGRILVITSKGDVT